MSNGIFPYSGKDLLSEDLQSIPPSHGGMGQSPPTGSVELDECDGSQFLAELFQDDDPFQKVNIRQAAKEIRYYDNH